MRHLKGNVESFVRIILYLKFSVYRIYELASRFIALVSILNNFQGDMFNIYILSCILKVFCYQR